MRLVNEKENTHDLVGGTTTVASPTISTLPLIITSLLTEASLRGVGALLTILLTVACSMSGQYGV